jgi:hypothetical protein
MQRLILTMSSFVAVAATPAAALAQDLQPPPSMDPNAPLAPPAAPAPGSPSAAQAEDLRESEKEDSGLGLEWVYMNAEVGGGYVDMESFNESSMALEKSHSGGPMFGAGLGIRLIFLTLGARVRDYQFSAFNLWQLDGEVGLHMRFGRVDPYLAVRGGYAFVGTLDSSSVSTATGSSPSDVTVHGFNLGLAFGLDYYFSSLVSLGGEIGGDALFLKRPAVALPAGFSQLPPAQQQQITSSALYANSGSSAGFGSALSAHLGIHF